MARKLWKVVDDERVRRFRPYGQGHLTWDGYVVVRVDGRLVREHRLVMERILGGWFDTGTPSNLPPGARQARFRGMSGNLPCPLNSAAP